MGVVEPRKAAKPNPKKKPEPAESIPFEVLEGVTADTLADIRELTWASIQDIFETGSPKDRLDLIQRLSPYVLKAAADKEVEEDDSERNREAIVEMMASLWPGRCQNCGHIMSEHARVEELEDDE